MNKVVQNILNSYHTKEAQLKELSKLAKDIEFAKGVVDGTYKYCKECDDYYLAKSFLHDSERKKSRICVYKDIINSGGNEYIDGYIHIKYEICPKGHKRETERIEERE